MVTSPVARAVDLLRGAGKVVALTGAGMSAESGVPTFRDARTGLWAKFDPEELATTRAFRRNPARVFAWYVSRLHAVRAASPHSGYDALVRLAQRWGDDFHIVTQNIDGLHGRAGSPQVVELHGSLEAFRCIECRCPFPADRVAELGDGTEEIVPPGCPECGNFIRPGVVWFGEMLPPDAVRRAWRLAETADVALVVGTSSLVHPAAELPTLVALGGGRVIEINPDATPLSPQADLYWPAVAGLALPALADALERADRCASGSNPGNVP